MELLGEEIGQLWGRRPLYIVGGNNPTVIPLSSPAQSGTTAREGRYYRSTQRYCHAAWGPDPRAVLLWGKVRYYRFDRYYRHNCRPKN